MFYSAEENRFQNFKEKDQVEHSAFFSFYSFRLRIRTKNIKGKTRLPLVIKDDLPAGPAQEGGQLGMIDAEMIRAVRGQEEESYAVFRNHIALVHLGAAKGTIHTNPSL